MYFEDWSKFTDILVNAQKDHGGKIIKVFASVADPRIRFPNIFIDEESDDLLTDVTWEYSKRGSFPGSSVESQITDLPTISKRSIRALLRFANRPNLNICQEGMLTRHKGVWLIEGPLGVIDGIIRAREIPDERSATLHLDVFMEHSLANLRVLFDFTDTGLLVPQLEGVTFKQELSSEWASGAERL